ncbi:hypothetical protein AB9P05_23845 [Roseivirga sp. BDSF3-8]|uniref:hypothetical protein n=1 Tax=Roseivirga sp. BDSF3-8 TaxID=3241598 RepID=UPI0035320030
MEVKSTIFAFALNTDFSYISDYYLHIFFCLLATFVLAGVFAYVRKSVKANLNIATKMEEKNRQLFDSPKDFPANKEPN